MRRLFHTPTSYKILLVTFLGLLTSLGAAMPGAGQQLVVDDFSGYAAGQVPYRWHARDGRRTFRINASFIRQSEYYKVVREGKKQVLEGYTRGTSHSIIMPNGIEMDWSIQNQKRLSWRWRALALPEGARESDKRLNDAGAALLVTFDADVLGRPRSIKYTYSSTLPVGTVVNHGRLKVLVVSSGAEGIGAWKSIERDVAADFRRVFGGEPPERPLSLMIWSDSDDTGDEARFQIADIRLKP